MTPEQRRRVDDLFDQVLALDSEARLEFIAAVDSHQSTVRLELAALLAHHQRAEQAGFLEYGPTQSDRNLLVETVADMAVQPPPVVAGYEILGVLGRGGMGIVYKARQIRLNRIVALKMILDSQFASAIARQRFLAEAEMIARLQHPNIVQIHEANTHEIGPFFSMEFVEGGSLASSLKGTPLPARQAADLVQTLARAIDTAHKAGIIHRDLNPGNILLTEEGVPKVMDFGIAKQLSDGPGMTETGVIMGTPGYMAPEQARGSSAGIGPACDIYALGAILYELLTGRPPFAAENSMETILQVLNLEPVPPRKLQPKMPRDLETICLKCLQKDPRQRYATAQDLSEDLSRFLQSRPILARPVGRVETAWRYCRRNSTLTGLTAALIVTLVGGLLGATWKSRDGWEKEATSKVELLRKADMDKVLEIVPGLSKYQPFIDSLVLDEFTNAEDGSKEKLNLSLALLSKSFMTMPSEQEKVSHYLFDRILDAKLENLQIIREVMLPHKSFVLEKLWDVAKSIEADPAKELRRLRAASALALFAPEDESNWNEVKDAIASDLVKTPVVQLYLWMKLMRDAKAALIGPLSNLFQDLKGQAGERLLAADILADFAEDDPKVLAELVMAADNPQFPIIFRKLRDSSRVEEYGVPLLHNELERLLPDETPSSDERRESQAKRQANAAVALLLLNKPERVWPLLKFDPRINPDPRVRSYLVHRMSQLGVDASAIIARLSVETDISIRRALILSLGEFTALSSSSRTHLLPILKGIYQDQNADAGLHAAAEWLLRNWKEEEWLAQTDEVYAKNADEQEEHLENIKKSLINSNVTNSRPWFVNSQKHVLVVIRGPTVFEMGSPLTEANRYSFEPTRRPVRISRTFAVASKHVTVGDFNQFLEERDPYVDRIEDRYQEGDPAKGLLNDPAKPVVFISWPEAVRYCNWLSEKDGIAKGQWCYEIVGQSVRPKKGYLNRTGYRLPTEAEVEYAIRGGASTARFFGETEELLTYYAWFQKNSLETKYNSTLNQAIGQKKPNDFGLFDMNGNVWIWCQQKYKPNQDIATLIEDEEDEWKVTGSISLDGSDNTANRKNPGDFIIVRGGSYGDSSKNLRSSARSQFLAWESQRDIGFRVARTIVD